MRECLLPDDAALGENQNSKLDGRPLPLATGSSPYHLRPTPLSSHLLLALVFFPKSVSRGALIMETMFLSDSDDDQPVASNVKNASSRAGPASGSGGLRQGDGKDRNASDCIGPQGQSVSRRSACATRGRPNGRRVRRASASVPMEAVHEEGELALTFHLHMYTDIAIVLSALQGVGSKPSSSDAAGTSFRVAPARRRVRDEGQICESGFQSSLGMQGLLTVGS